MSGKHKNVCKALNYFFCFSSCLSISAFALLISISVGFASSAAGGKICEITGSQINQLKNINQLLPKN